MRNQALLCLWSNSLESLQCETCSSASHLRSFLPSVSVYKEEWVAASLENCDLSFEGFCLLYILMQTLKSFM